MRVLLFVLSNVSFLQLAGNLWQNFTGVVGEVQISDLLRRYRDNCKGLPVLLNGGTTNLQQNTSSENNKGLLILLNGCTTNIHLKRLMKQHSHMESKSIIIYCTCTSMVLSQNLADKTDKVTNAWLLHTGIMFNHKSMTIQF